jgi:ankyrin repeat protein
MGHPRVVSVLLEYKADVKAENLSGETAMGLAASNQRTDVVDLLEGYSS